MATTKKPTLQKPAKRSEIATKHTLPAALRERAEAASKAAQARHLREARAALARAREALETAESGLYEVALALKELDDPRLLAALGEKTVYTAAERHLGLSRSTVVRLRRAADAVDATRFAALGHTKVNAMLELADATPDDDADAILAEGTVTLWAGGPAFDVKGASAREIYAAAAEVRAHVGGMGEARGNRVKADERALAKSLTDALAARGIAVAVKARATKPGSPARYELAALDADAARALLTALAAKKSR